MSKLPLILLALPLSAHSAQITPDQYCETIATYAENVMEIRQANYPANIIPTSNIIEARIVIEAYSIPLVNDRYSIKYAFSNNMHEQCKIAMESSK